MGQHLRKRQENEKRIRKLLKMHCKIFMQRYYIKYMVYVVKHIFLCRYDKYFRRRRVNKSETVAWKTELGSDNENKCPYVNIKKKVIQ